MYSTIKQKKCKCGECNRYPTLGCSGFNYACLPEDLKEKIGAKKDLQIKKSNAAKYASTKLRRLQNNIEGSDKLVGDNWFNERHKEMTGKCLVCGGQTCKDSFNFKNSIAHLFQKAYFKNIKWHEENYIELCFYGNSCHTNFDNCILTFEDLKHTQAWDVIVRKFKVLYPLMNANEQGRVPTILMKELN